ncbi:MAG: HlyD family secretion protein [Devosia sp.]|nr:HlyD family secretion protein [Devosia sp.]
MLDIVPGSGPGRSRSPRFATEIDPIAVGQSVQLRLAAFNRRTAPEPTGTVQRIAADAIRDERTGRSYFEVRIVIPDDQRLALAGDERLVPGMVAEAHFATEARSIASYLLQPLVEQLGRAFRER